MSAPTVRASTTIARGAIRVAGAAAQATGRQVAIAIEQSYRIAYCQERIARMRYDTLCEVRYCNITHS